MQELDLLEILKAGEKVDIECKEGTNEIPKSLWESYSAMANTSGGKILLGIKEVKNSDEFIVIGVKNANRRVKEFWDTINGCKANRNLLIDKDVEVLNIEGKDVIIINVPRANYKEKPIFLNENPYKGTYKRNSEGDYKCTEEEVKAMIRDASDEGNDGTILEHYTLDDLHEETLKKYRNRFSSRQPDHPWNELDNERFLEMLGAIREDRRRGIKGVTVAGMLMFGQGLYFRDLFSNINLDFRDETDIENGERWSDRITIDGMWENNLYNFYFMVINKLSNNLRVPFKLENLERKDDTAVHQAIREAFVNQIIHSDFNVQGVLKIIKKKDCLEFTNPGTLKIDLESIFKGGNSKSRNPRIQKMFTMIGLGEGAGSGFPKILSAWNEQHWRIPDLKEESNLNQVTLKLWTVSMIPDECLKELKNIFKDKFKYLSRDEIVILSTAYLEDNVNNSTLQLMIDKHSYDITKILHNLVEKDMLIVDGYGKGKIYYLNKEYNTDCSIENKDLSEDEKVIIEFIKENGYINNELARERLSFGKHKNIGLFKKLMKRGLIERVGKSSATKYVLK